jgi:hypothetical protein
MADIWRFYAVLTGSLQFPGWSRVAWIDCRDGFILGIMVLPAVIRESEKAVLLLNFAAIVLPGRVGKKLRG